MTARLITRVGRIVVTGIRKRCITVSSGLHTVDGAVNKALITLLSQAPSVSRKAVRIQHDTRSGTKSVEIESLSASDILDRLVILPKE